MQLYIYDLNRVLLGVLESFEYLCWTRRYSACGGFELKAVAGAHNLALLSMGHILWKSDDEEAGFIEYIELVMDEQESILVRGRFATGVLARRIVWGTEILNFDISNGISQLITNHMLEPSDTSRRIMGYSLLSPDFGFLLNTQVSYRNLLETVESLCEAADIGIKTVWYPSALQFVVTIYKGTNSLAVFSREYENLTSQTYIHSELSIATSALVAGEGEGEERRIVEVGGSGTGMDRYEMFVDAKDLREETFGESYTTALIRRGEAKLAEQAVIRSFDAAVNPHGNLRYKVDFDIGQTVKILSKSWGISLTARITEIEETHDRDGISLQVVFGRGLLTLAQKIKGGM